MEPVEQVALLEALGLGSVEVLGGLGVVAQRSTAEADDAPGGAEDREHEPVAEAIPGVALVLLAREQAGRLEVLRAEATAQRAGEEVEPVGRVAEPEALRHRLRDAPGGEVLRRLARARELGGVEVRGGAQDLFWIGTAAAGVHRRGQRDAVGARQRFDRGGKVVAARLHVEADGVAADAAAEAVEEAPRRVEAERRRLFFVEGAEAPVPITALFEPGDRPGDIEDVDRVADGLDQLRGEMDVAERHGAGAGASRRRLRSEAGSGRE